MNGSTRLLVAGVLVIVGALAGQAMTGQDPAGDDRAGDGGQAMDAAHTTVARIVDGDTLYLSGFDESVRLIGVDTPESVHPTVSDECYGTASTRTLSDLIPPGSTVGVSYDVERTDHYGRTLAYVWTDDGANVSVELVRLGAGVVLTVPPNEAFVAELEAAEVAARAADRGLWGAC